MLSIRGVVGGAVGGLGVGALAGALLGDWIPTALTGFQAGPGAAWLAWMLAAAWVKGAPFLALGAAVGATRGAGVPVRIGVPVLAVLAIERLQSIEPLGAPWTLLGHSQASNLGVAQLAVIGGVPLVSALVFATNLSIAELASVPERRRIGRRLLAASLAAVAVLSVFGLRVAQTFGAASDGPAQRVLGIQVSIPRGERWIDAVQRSNLSAGLTNARNAMNELGSRPDLVVLPESLVTTPVEDAPYFVADVSTFARAAGVSVVLGGIRKATSHHPTTYRNSAFLFDRTGALTATVDKRVGVPFVESRPSAVVGWLWPLLGGLSKGPKMEIGDPPKGADEGPYVVLLCYEVFFPGLAAARRTQESSAILQLADDSWAEGTSMSRQVLAAAAFRAIEQRLTLVRVAHGGLSAVIDPYGRVVEELPAGSRGHVLAAVRRTPPPTLAEKIALAAVAIAGGALGYGAAILLGAGRALLGVRATATLLAGLLLLHPLAARAEEDVATLELDSFSYISLGGQQNLALPPGSRVRFRFEKPANGKVPFTIHPEDVSIPPIEVSKEVKLHYGLAGIASGSIDVSPGPDPSVTFTGPVKVTLETSNSPQNASFSVTFTTGITTATSADGVTGVRIEGVRLVEKARFLQLVGSVTNRSDALLAPGAAVSTVLSGTFDRLPALR